MQRRTVAALALAAMVVLSGCSFLSGPITFSASKATVNDQAVSDTGYEEVNVSEMVITREFSAAGQSKEVKVTNWIAQYERTVDLGPIGEKRAAVFSAVSTPQVQILDREFNPVGDYSNRELVQLLQSQYESISNIQSVDSRNTTVLGEETKVSKFSAQATLQGGQQMDVYLHVTKVQHQGDYVVAVAVYPQDLDEEQKVFTMLQGIEHSGDEDSSGNESS